MAWNPRSVDAWRVWLGRRDPKKVPIKIGKLRKAIGREFPELFTELRGKDVAVLHGGGDPFAVTLSSYQGKVECPPGSRPHLDAFLRWFNRNTGWLVYDWDRGVLVHSFDLTCSTCADVYEAHRPECPTCGHPSAL
jgi:hypothetical protein